MPNILAGTGRRAKSMVKKMGPDYIRAHDFCRFNKSQTLQALKKYLDINGYKKNIKIDFSKLPIRF